MSRRRTERIGLLFLGTVMGFAFTVLAIYLFVRSTQTRKITERVQVALGLPREAFELERVYPDGSLVIALRQVAFLDPNGDTIVSAPLARAKLDARSMNGSGPIVLREGEVIRPYLRLSQNAAGEWNALGIAAVEADGNRVGGAAADSADAPAARSIAIRGLRIVDGRARVAMPMAGEPVAPTGKFASLPQPQILREGGRWVRITWLEDLDAQMPLVRMGGNAGWRVEIASLSARVRNPDTRIERLAGWMEDRGDQVIRFEMRELRTPHSRFAGAGAIRVPEGEDLRYDVRLTARPLDFRDLAGMGFAVPNQGTASFDLAIQTLDARRTRWTLTDARVAMLDSRVTGRLTAITGPGMDPQFSDTRLVLDPLRIDDLERLGYLDQPPVTGDIRGTITSAGTLSAGGGPLDVDLTASVAARGGGGDAPVSTITLAGPVTWKAGVEDAIRFQGLRVEARPLHLATLRALSPENAAMLRGTLRGGATVTGSMRSFRVEGGDLAYQVGTAPESRLRGVTGQVALGPPMRYQLRGRADPLALATLTELFPSLPFRNASLAGPIEVTGNGDDVGFDVNLDGPAGALAARGSLTLGPVTRFDVNGRVEAFRPGAVVNREVPLEGPLTGTFSARGSTADFRFGSDFTMGGGRLTLNGNFRRSPGDLPPQLDITGQAENFRVGAVMGRPELLPDPVSGPIRVAGGGREPYRFDVDLRGALGRLDVDGFFRPGTVPEYSIRGDVVGLDLSALPGGRAFPRTRLTGRLAVDGRGTTPETFAGTVDFRAGPGSTIGRYPLEAGLARFTAENGILRVDTVAFAARSARFHASGQFGLTRPAPQPLRFTLQATDLAALRPVIPGGDTLPDLGGQLAASGFLSGTLKQPAVNARGEGARLRYGKYAAGTLAFDVNLTKGTPNWTGTATLNGTDLQLGGAQRLATLRLETSLAQGSATFSFSARRDATTDFAAAGTLELDGLTPRAAVFDALTLRLSDTEWRLTERGRVAWGVNGLAVENLRLRRADGQGYLEADGSLPQHGVADLRVRAFGIELADFRRFSPAFPPVSGLLGAEFAVAGPVSAPQMRLDLRIDSLAAGGVTSDRLLIAGRYNNGRMDFTGDLTFAGRKVVDLRAGVPMQLSLDGVVPAIEIVQQGELTATLVADSLPLALVASASQSVTDAEGILRARVDVAGTPRSPTVAGFADLHGGAFQLVPLGVRWHDVNGVVSMRGEVVTLDSLVARTGDQGIARASGSVRLDDTRRPLVDLRLFMDDFEVMDRRDLAQMTGDADLTLTGRFPSPVLTGRVKLDEGTLYIPETGAETEGDILAADIGAIGADTVTAPTAGMVLLANMIARDLTVTIGDAVWLQSPDARIQIAGELLVERNAGDELPVLYGDLEAVRGSYRLKIGLLTREFEIASGRVQFFGTPEMNPSLDIVAIHEIRSPDATTQEVTVQVNITGTLQDPRVALSAGGTRQPLSESEVASLLLFGRTSSGGGAFQALQAQLTGEFLVEAVAGSLLAPIEEVLIRRGWVDYVRIRTRPTGFSSFATARGTTNFLNAISIEVGRELIDDVFLTAEVANVLDVENLQWGLSLDWDISSTLSLRGGWEPTRRDPTFRDLQRSLNLPSRQISTDLRWRFEYGRPPPQEPEIPKPERQPAPGEPATPTGQPPPPPPPDNPTPR